MASAKPKPATNGLGSVEVDGLQRWGEVAPTAMEADPSEALLLDDMATSPFVMNEELNFRIALWQGDVTTLKVDAVVNCNNDDLNERSGVSGQLFVAAGPQLEEACTRLGGCQPGQAKATRGFKLPAKHVIHTVPPPWLDGREAEAALERCRVRRPLRGRMQGQRQAGQHALERCPRAIRGARQMGVHRHDDDVHRGVLSGRSATSHRRASPR